MSDDGYTPAQMRRAAEQHGNVVLRYLKFLRAHYERTGVHFGDQIGGGDHVTGEVPRRHRRH